MAHALRRNDEIDPLWDHLIQARLHLTTFCFRPAPSGLGRMLTFTDAISAAAAVHRVVVFDHPDLVRAHPEGFNDGMFAFLPSRFGLNLLIDHEPLDVPAIQRWLHDHLDDMVANVQGQTCREGLHRVERADLQRWVTAHTDEPPLLGFGLDAGLLPVLRSLYHQPSLNVQTVLHASGVDSTLVLDQALGHGAWDHPLVSVAHIAQNNLLAQRAGEGRSSHDVSGGVISEAAQAWAAHFNSCEPFLQNIMAGEASNVIRTMGSDQEGLELFMQAASEHPMFTLAGRRALIHALAGYTGVAPAQHAAAMAEEMVDEESLWATPSNEVVSAPVMRFR